MTKNRTAYWREYNRKNSARKKEISKAFRERNREKIAAYKRALRAATKGDPRKPGAPRVAKPRIQKPKTDEAKTEALLTLQEKFAAFRASRQSKPINSPLDARP
jgi:hypothetical protein